MLFSTWRFILAAPLFLASGLYAGIPDNFAASGKLAGRASAGSAVEQSWNSAFTNPGAMAAPGTTSSNVEHMAGGGLFFQQPLMFINPKTDSVVAQNNAKIGEQVDVYPALMFGVNFDVRKLMKVPANLPVKMGLMVTLPGIGDEVARFSETSQNFYNFQRLGRNQSYPSVATSFAVQAWKNRLSFGAGLHYSATVDGQIEMTELSADSTKPPATDTLLEISLKPALIAGVVYHHPLTKNHRLSSGLAFRQTNMAEAEVKIDVDLPVAGLSIFHSLQTDLLAYYQPHVVTWSNSYFYKQLRFYLDLEWQGWSQFRLSDSRRQYENDPNFNDVIETRIGAEMHTPFWELKLLAGYGFANSMSPDQIGHSNYLDNAKHKIGFGLSRLFQSVPRIRFQSIEVNLGMQLQFWSQRSTLKKERSLLPDGTRQPDYQYGGLVVLSILSVTLRI